MANKIMTNETSWKTVKKRCALDESELWMARRLGIRPETVLSMRPAAAERWKDPAALRIRRIYEKEFGSRRALEEKLQSALKALAAADRAPAEGNRPGQEKGGQRREKEEGN